MHLRHYPAVGDEQVTPGLEFTDASAADLSVIDQLRDHGADLSKARHVKAYIYFRTKPDAERAAADLASEGFRGSLGSNEAEDSWLATVELEIVVSAESIADLSTCLQAVADRHHGDYDGWEASAAP